MEDSSYKELKASFANDVVRESLKTQYQNPKMKISDEVVDSVNEILKILVVETVLRSSKLATMDNKTSVNLDHVESVLASVMLDFP